MTDHGQGLPPGLENDAGAADLVSYQEGSIVSRILLKKKAGTVTLFAFDKGQLLSEHKTPFDALVHVLEGTAEITVGGEPHVLEAGDLLLLPANIPHKVTATRRFKMLLTMIRSD